NARPYGIGLGTTVGGGLFDNIYGKRVLSRADHMIAVSGSLRDDISRYRSVDKNKISVIHNGVDTNFFKPSPPTYREKYADGMDHLILFLGRIVKQKGLESLLKAFPAVLKEHPKTMLAIVGKGNQKEGLIKTTKRMGLEKNVVFPGFVPAEHLPSLLSSTDIYILPSVWETFGISLAEAMACGCASVASDVGGIPEVLGDRSGFLFQPLEHRVMAEKINLLLSDQKLREDFATGARKRAVEVFDWDIIARRTRSFYTSLLNG
ncbi:MAG: glycosyltransferase family 4 protein, partial [Thermoplasmata archaeon]|nr:glycosyltransferase family 4 protein [Thermoplasmata archaeon]